MGVSPHWCMEFIQWGELDRNSLGHLAWVAQWRAVYIQLLQSLGNTNSAILEGWLRPLLAYQGGRDPMEPLIHDHLCHRGPPSHPRALGHTPLHHPDMVCWWRRGRDESWVDPRTLPWSAGLGGTKGVLPATDQEYLGHSPAERGQVRGTIQVHGDEGSHQ